MVASKVLQAAGEAGLVEVVGRGEGAVEAIANGGNLLEIAEDTGGAKWHARVRIGIREANHAQVTRRLGEVVPTVQFVPRLI